ncbi:alpha/beta hydrolase [Camelimonas sp. ID_303_24]
MVTARGAGAPFVLPGSREFACAARDGAAYSLLIHIPEAPPPPAGFPVIALVDGRALFAAAVMAMRLQSGRPGVTGVGPAVIVGVGYPGEALFDVGRRAGDLLPADGGADRFLATLLDEILPWVGGLAPLDATQRALVGHSYGGLFVLHALFARPSAFAAFIAGSPSIWRAAGSLRAAETAFIPPPDGARPRLLVTVGGDEQERHADDSPERAARRAMARMRDNAAELTQRLSACGAATCTFTVFPDENHISVIPAMLSRAVAFALGQAGVTEGCRP